MNIIVAYRPEHVQFFLRHVGWNPKECRIVNQAYKLRGFGDATVWMISAERHSPTWRELDNRTEIREVIRPLRGINVIEVTI